MKTHILVICGNHGSTFLKLTDDSRKNEIKVMAAYLAKMGIEHYTAVPGAFMSRSNIDNFVKLAVADHGWIPASDNLSGSDIVGYALFTVSKAPKSIRLEKFETGEKCCFNHAIEQVLEGEYAVYDDDGAPHQEYHLFGELPEPEKEEKHRGFVEFPVDEDKAAISLCCPKCNNDSLYLALGCDRHSNGLGVRRIPVYVRQDGSIAVSPEPDLKGSIGEALIQADKDFQDEKARGGIPAQTDETQ